MRFRRSAPDRIVRSRTPAHPAIISVAEFTEAQLARRHRVNQSRVQAAPRVARSKRAYQLRSRIRCSGCQRRMQPQAVREVIYYRCRARDLAPASPAAAEHPPTVNLREDRLVPAIDGWLATLFDRENLDATVATIVASQHDANDVHREQLQQRLHAAEISVQRHLAAIEAGVNPHSLVTAMSKAHAEKATLEPELQQIPKPVTLTATEIRKLIESLGDIRTVLREGEPEDKEALYRAFELEVLYQHQHHRATISISPCVVTERVRRGT
ncbi:zinc ribbon domain-containing protein [Nocardia jiangsuensis]|uniref:Zinc ribbon domain-containing protein n=1 Tax=Nocardia jiangsuensis TaxID=1691563 RepID=A0ABV8DPP3_9NOCA